MTVHLADMVVPKMSVFKRVLSFHSCIFRFLNALFILHVEDEIYKLAHVTMLEWVGNLIPHGPEGMFYVKSCPKGEEEIVVGIRNIELVVHLVPFEPDWKCIVNNHIDYHVWNEMNDGKSYRLLYQ